MHRAVESRVDSAAAPASLTTLERVFHEVADLPPGRRAEALRAACGGDESLRRDVEALLGHDGGEASCVVDQPPTLLAAAIASPVVGVDGVGSAAATRGARREPQPADPPPSIGRFRLRRLIGAGGMADVYEAEQDSPRRSVALKVLRQGMRSAAMTRRLGREAEVLGALRHPGIAHVYEAGTARIAGESTREVDYIAMELVVGEPLDRHIDRGSPDTRARVELVARICDAVEHAHRHGVVHRDLKPANILVDESGQPKVLDFGIARLVGAAAIEPTAVTAAGQLLGTLPYMSPEQLAGDGASVDARSDVYALGVILYQSLAGRLPHDLSGRSLAEALSIVRRGDCAAAIAALSRMELTGTPRFRADLASIVGKALETDPARRYPSAAALAADLRRHLADEPVDARAPGLAYRAAKFVRRHRVVVAAAALVAVVVATGSVTTAMFARSARESAAAAQLADQRADGHREVSDVNSTIARSVLEAASRGGTMPADEASRRIREAARLLSTDPAAARERLLEVPEDRRDEHWRAIWGLVEREGATGATP